MALLLFFCGINSCFSIGECGIMGKTECGNQTYKSEFPYPRSSIALTSSTVYTPSFLLCSTI